MEPNTLSKLSGLSLLFGGILAAAGWLLFTLLDPYHKNYSDRLWLPLNFLIITGGVLMTLGLPGLYVSISKESGLLGLIGFVLLFVGLVIPYVAVQSIEAVSAPTFPENARLLVAIGAPSIFLGSTLTGLSLWRSEVYPPMAGIMLVLAALLGLLTVVDGVPAWIGRGGAASAVFTGVMATLGFLLLRL